MVETSTYASLQNATGMLPVELPVLGLIRAKVSFIEVKHTYIIAEEEEQL